MTSTFKIDLSYINGPLNTKVAQFKYGGTIKAFYIPKNNINEITDKYLQNKSGIYLYLSSLNIYSKNFTIYVGQSEKLNNRIKAPHKNRNHSHLNWKYVLAFTNVGRSLSTDEILYLEETIYNILYSFNFNLSNGKPPKGTSNLDNNSKLGLNKYPLNDIKILSASLNFPIFYTKKIYNENNKIKNIPIHFILNERGAKGYGYIQDNRFIVKNGSIVTKRPTNKSYTGKKEDITKMIQKGFLNKDLKFIHEYSFNSKSAAANFLEQSRINGQKAWKIKK